MLVGLELKDGESITNRVQMKKNPSKTSSAKATIFKGIKNKKPSETHKASNQNNRYYCWIPHLFKCMFTYQNSNKKQY